MPSWTSFLASIAKVLLFASASRRAFDGLLTCYNPLMPGAFDDDRTATTRGARLFFDNK